MNVTERKLTEMALRESEEKYREAYNRAEFYKDLFTHDINNILQSILIGAQLSQMVIDKPEKAEDIKKNADLIKNQAIRGSKIVSDVRKLSQLERIAQNLKKIEISNVLKNVIAIIKKFYEDKNLRIRLDSVEERLFIQGNDLLEDVFQNLLINAVKHNNNLIIEITIKISRYLKKDINYIKLEFLDNGLGVADSMKKSIFRRGYSTDKNLLGMGLGLSLVQRIIEYYNGKIWVEDRIKGDRSKGSNFVLLIPEVD